MLRTCRRINISLSLAAAVNTDVKLFIPREKSLCVRVSTRGAAQRARTETTHVYARSRRTGALTRCRAQSGYTVLETGGRKASW